MADLTEAETQILRAFQKLVRRLFDSNLVRTPPPRVRISRKFDYVGGGHEDRFEGYDADALQAQLPLLRQFIEDGEKAQLGRVLNLVAWKCPDEELRRQAGDVKEQWHTLLKREPDSLEQGVYGLTDTLFQECRNLFYGAEGLYHVDPTASVTECQSVFTGARLHLYLRGLIGCLGESHRLISVWLDNGEQESPAQRQLSAAAAVSQSIEKHD